MTHLSLAGIACVRGGRPLFAGVSLTLAAGGAALVTGANGAGKSSLLRIAAGLLTPAAGTVEHDGERALLTDAPALDGERPLRHALGWWATAGGVDQALADTGLTALADAPVRWLSTGQRKRAGIARVLVSGAAIWLLDEPTNGLDASSVTMLEGLVAAHRARGGIAVVATHLQIDLPGAAGVTL